MIHQNNFIGKYIGGSYKIIAEIGDGIGTFGSVYLAEHIIFTERARVAIKLLHPNLPPQEHNRFFQEARLLEQLKHPHILRIVQAGIQDNIPFLITEYAAHGSLKSRMKQPLPLERAFTIISQIGQALYDAHKQGIVHRDLKPENILLDAEDNALLADFGISLVLDKGATAIGQEIEGTLPYMAPEQFRGQVSVKSDQYALGCIAYELLTGRKPIAAAIGYSVNREAKIALWAQAHDDHSKLIPPTTINTDLSEQVEAAILKALAKNRQDRHASISDFLFALGLTPPEPITGKLPVSDLLHAAARLINDGDTFFRGEDYEQALHAYNSSLILDPDNADTYLRIGNVFRQLKRSTEALDAYEKGVQVAPENKRDIYYCNMGHVLCDLKMYEDAVKAYNQAIRLSPKKAIFHVYKGDALRNSTYKDFKGALYAYEEALKYSTSGITSARAYAAKGEAHMGLRHYPEAIKAYEEAIKQHPTNVLLYLAKGYVHWKCRQFEEACKAYTEGLKVDPTHQDLLERKNLECR